MKNNPFEPKPTRTPKLRAHPHKSKMKSPGIVSFLRSAALLSGMAFVSIAVAQPSITGVYPDGARLFQYSPTLSFMASSPAGVTNVTVALTSKKMNGETLLQNLTADKGLTLAGPNTGETVSATLKSNRLYTADITIQDATGASANQTVSFTTINPSYTFEAEDWDYTDSASGLYFDNPQTNAYAGRATTSGVDAYISDNEGGQAYRPGGTSANGGLGNEATGDNPRRAQYLNGLTDYNVGWTSGGEWANYTRHFPAGTYNIYARAANPNGATTDSMDVSVGGAPLGRFAIPNTGGWQNYQFVPLTDAGGSLVEVTLDGTLQTARLDFVQASCNVNFFMFLPPDTETNSVGDIAFTSFYPDGAYQFQPTNTFAMDITSSVDIYAGDIIMVVNATNLNGQGTSKTLTSANGLTVGGTPTSRVVTMPLTSNTVYTVTIQVFDADNNTASTNLLFDTITPAYTFEAEDWNYTDYGLNPPSGRFVDNPQTNAYADLYAEEGIDFHRAGGEVHNNYGTRAGLSTEGAGDILRMDHEGFQDYNLGWAYGGNWANYTRTFPAGVYEIYVRVASGNTGGQTGAASLSEVIGATTTEQTVSDVGTFDVPGTGGWQRYVWMPVRNPAGNVARFTGGAVKTLRYTITGGGHNIGFFMLMPADLSQSPPPFVSNFRPASGGIFQVTNQMTFTANSSVGITDAGINVTLNGINVNSKLTFGGSTSARIVTCPVETNKLYTAIITLTDAAGTTSSTNIFETFEPTTFVFETEDYDYNGGLFFDGMINGYYGLPSVFDVDEHDNAHAGNAYRPSGNAGSGIPGLEIEVAGDVTRPGYESGTGFVDYNTGYNDAGNWANYTRTYPAGTYNVYMRVASPSDAPNGRANAAKLSRVTGGWGTISQTLTDLGFFAPKYTGDWHRFAWTPLLDSAGLPVRLELDGFTNTFRVSIVGGGININFYALVPADLTVPVLSDAYPNGTYQFQAASTLSFTASSTAGINGSDISVQLTGTDMSGQTVVTNFTTANGLVIGGTSTAVNVSLPLSANVIYTAVITITSVNGNTTISRLSFDTITPAYLFEAEDWNYTDTNTPTAGLFFDNPQTNAYAGRSSTDGVDSHNTDTSSAYRPAGTTGGMATEGCGDIARQKFMGTGFGDYNVGWTGGGDWANYTRNYPAGVYNLFMRGANGGNSYQQDAASVSRVTSGVTTTNQTTALLGTFSVPGLGGWQVYSDVPLIDPDGNYAQFVGGSLQTLKIATVGGNYNANYYFMMPAETNRPVNPPKLKAAALDGKVVVSFLSRTNKNYQLLFKSQLLDATWTPVGLIIPGNSLILSVTNTPSGDSGFYRLQSVN